mgnify:CR=1 FL=1
MERLNHKTGVWEKMKIDNIEQYLDDDKEMQMALIDIAITISEIYHENININELN